jgi:hypothetical protein
VIGRLSLVWWSLVKGYRISPGVKSEKGVKGAKGKKQDKYPQIAQIFADWAGYQYILTGLIPIHRDYYAARFTGFILTTDYTDFKDCDFAAEENEGHRETNNYIAIYSVFSVALCGPVLKFCRPFRAKRVGGSGTGGWRTPAKYFRPFRPVWEPACAGRT